MKIHSLTLFIAALTALSAQTAFAESAPAASVIAKTSLMQVDTQYRPLTRAEFTRIVVHDLYPDDLQLDCLGQLALPFHNYTKLFADVSRTDDDAADLCIAIKNGLISGDRNARFRPNDLINVAEASKILGQAYGIALPDSVKIRVLPWHWRYTEALKRRGVLPYGLKDYSQNVTADDAVQLQLALARWKPIRLSPSPSAASPSQTEPTNFTASENTQVIAPVAPNVLPRRHATVGNYHMRLFEPALSQ